MQPLQVKFKIIHPDAKVPQYQTPGSAAMDIHAVVHRDKNVKQFLRRESDVVYDEIIPALGGVIVRTGLMFEVPPGFVMMVNSRSGHGFKWGVRLSNAQGWIDSDYRGELMIALHNDSPEPMGFNHGERIAQMLIMPIPRVQLVEVDELSETERGEGGMGSTGK